MHATPDATQDSRPNEPSKRCIFSTSFVLFNARTSIPLDARYKEVQKSVRHRLFKSLKKGKSRKGEKAVPVDDSPSD